MIWRKIGKHKPSKPGKYITERGPVYFQVGVWKMRGIKSVLWLDEIGEAWVDIAAGGLPESDIPLFVFVPKFGVSISAVFNGDSGAFQFLGIDGVSIKEEISHYMIQPFPPDDYMEMLRMAQQLKQDQKINSPIPTEPS